MGVRMKGDPELPDEDEQDQPVHEVVERIAVAAEDDPVRIRNIVESFGQRSFVPLLMVPALLVVSPLSGIPLFSSICGATIALISAQMIFGRDHVWLPGFIMRRELKRRWARKAVSRLWGLADKIDSFSGRHLEVLVASPAGKKVTECLCFISGFGMLFLEAIPFSSSVLGLTAILLGTALITRDGRLVIAGAACLAVALAIPIFALDMLISG